MLPGCKEKKRIKELQMRNRDEIFLVIRAFAPFSAADPQSDSRLAMSSNVLSPLLILRGIVKGKICNRNQRGRSKKEGWRLVEWLRPTLERVVERWVIERVQAGTGTAGQLSTEGNLPQNNRRQAVAGAAASTERNTVHSRGASNMHSRSGNESTNTIITTTKQPKKISFH